MRREESDEGRVTKESNSLISRIYPTHDDSVGVAAFATGGRASLPRLDACELAEAELANRDSGEKV